MDGQALNGLAVDADGAPIRAHQAHDHVKRSGFARTVGAQQTHHFTFVDANRDVLHHHPAAVRLAQVQGLQATVRTGRRQRARYRNHFLAPLSVRGDKTARTREPSGLTPSAGVVLLPSMRPSTVKTSVRLL